ncbi:MAG TPA: ABC transporter permease, partial [Dermatophilaceae bacterium]|nr:ABC transporter permease [Dermatophilaceae bacterium]
MSTSTASAPTATTVARRARRNRLLLLAGLGLVALSITRVISGEGVLTASGTINAMVWLTLPVALAGLGGLISERAGVVNIGLEGMMMLGVWGAGFAGWRWGPLAALVAALIGGALGGLLHALATVTFGVDHIVSGVAINLLAAGTVRFLSELTFTPSTGGGPTQSPPMSGNIPTFDIPVLASGPDVLGSVERTGIPVLADAAGVLRGLMVGITPYELLGLAMFPLTAYLLWRT